MYTKIRNNCLLLERFAVIFENAFRASYLAPTGG